MPGPTDRGGEVIVQLGGVDESVAATVGGQAALYVQNMEYEPEGFWRRMGGTIQIGTWVPNDSVVFGIHWFNPRPGQRWLVTERAINDETSVLEYTDFPLLTRVEIVRRRRLAGVGARSTFVERGRDLYHVNGYDTPIRWDGYRVVPLGFPQPPAPPTVGGSRDTDTASAFVDRAGGTWSNSTGHETDPGLQRGLGEQGTEVTSGADIMAEWVYGWGRTFVNDRGMESPLSPLAFASGKNAPITTNNALSGLTGAHLSFGAAPAWCVEQRIYRTLNLIGAQQLTGQETVYRHSAWKTAAAFEFIDIKPDTELRAQFDTDQVGATPRGASAMAFWQGRTWLLVDDNLYYSHGRFYEQFPANNVLPIGSGASGRGTALVPLADGLLVTKGSGTFMVKGDSARGYRIETLSEEVGTDSPRTMVSVHGVGVLFLSDKGPQLVQGRLEADAPSSLVPLVRGIRKTWRNLVGKSVLQTAWAVHNPETQEVWFHVPLGGDPRPRFGLVYHYGLGQWSFRPDWPFACATIYKGHVYLGSHDLTSSGAQGVHVITHGSLQLLGESFDAIYETGHLQPSKVRVTVHRLELRVYGGVGKITGVEWRGDRAPSYKDQMETRTRLQQQAERNTDKYNVGKYDGVSLWVDDEFAWLPVSLYGTFALEHSFKFTGSLRIASIKLGSDDAFLERKD